MYIVRLEIQVFKNQIFPIKNHINIFLNLFELRKLLLEILMFPSQPSKFLYYLPSNINKTYDVEKYFLLDEKFMLTLFRMDLCKSPDGLGAAKRSKSILAITCHTYSIMMELRTLIPYPKNIQKIYYLGDTYFEFFWHQHFFTRDKQILLYQQIRIQISFL